MKLTMNKPRRDDFVNNFMSTYSSPGIGIKERETIYNSFYEITELKNSYKVTVKGKTKRFSNLCFAAEFIFDNTFDQRYVYYPPPSAYQMRKMRDTMDRVTQLREAYC